MKTYVVDLETTDLKADIGTLIVACFGELNSEGKIVKMHSRTIGDMAGKTVAQRELNLVLWTIEKWEEADVIIGQNHKAFDQKFLQGVMLRHGINNGILAPRILIDTYQTGKGSFDMSMSMANLVDILGIGSKDAPEKSQWREANHGDPKAMERIKQRCISDVRMTAEIWNKLKPTYMRKYGK